MSMTTPARPAAASVPGPAAAIRVTQWRVLRSEWTKLWSLRSTRWALLVSFVAMAALGVIISAVQMAQLGFWLGWDAANAATMPNWVAGDEFRAARDRSLK